MSVNEQKLREKLDMILDFMKDNKLISEKACEDMKTEKEGGFLDTLVKDLSNSGMEDKDIRDEHFQKKLMGTLVSHSLGMNEAVKMGMDVLTTALTLKNPKDTTKDSVPFEQTLGNPEANKALDKLQAQSIILSSALNNDKLHVNPLKLDGPKPDFGAIAKHMMTDFKKTMEKKFEKNETEKKEFEKLSKEIEKQLTDTLRNAYAGDDPRIAGEVTGPILGPILSVMADWIEPEANPTSVAARVMEATEDLPGNDPLGIKDKHKKSTAEQVAGILLPILECVTRELDHQDKMTPRYNHHQ